ncbi:cyclic-di-AMP receptor [Clostridium sp. PL3]|uniref:Cyclic-di-AMP receptor n=1 Tax=Clostridium thailandense TaxID=2794346 RepID=A0A949X3K5_9CLOT|nr:cyclic-di-AMP receptor [Clostridium thailandense]MBV7272553.1 cyclic-di-AMP receptor [Clostridium thailandense]
MKLVIVIVQHKDSVELIKVLTEGKFMVTKLASTGGFLRAGNTTLFIGVESEKVEEVIDIIKSKCKKREKTIISPYPVADSTGINIPYTYDIEVEVGGATIFVVDVDKFMKI